VKILFLIARADTVAGAQVHVRDLAVALQQDGHKILILTGQRGIYNEALERENIQSIACEDLQQKINPLRDWQSLNWILQAIKNFQPDLIATHSSKTGILGRIACKISKTPCTFTAHGWSFSETVPEPSRSIYQFIEKLVEPLSDRIICVSHSDHSLGIKVGMQRDRLLTIHNGMKDIPNLRANPSQSNPVKIAMVARFARQKDHHSLIEAFQHLDGAELILLGDGPLTPEIQALVNQLKLSEKVKFLGFRKNVEEILAQVQIFALISHWEGLPCTIIEAMRSGLPVIASDVGGVREIIEDNRTGYLIPHGNKEILTQKLRELVADTSLRTQMGSLGRQKYESQFKFEPMYAKTLEVYQSLVASF
jgi:glycosyltransferase involved in cell wall biosynthesis